MPHQRDASLLKETPIEGIFKKVMHRKMTTYERICFHLKRRIKPPRRNGMAGPSVTKAHRANLIQN